MDQSFTLVTLKSGWVDRYIYTQYRQDVVSRGSAQQSHFITIKPEVPGGSILIAWQLDWPWRLVDTVHFTTEFEASLASMINSGTFRAVLATPPVEFKRWKVTSQVRPAPYDAL